MLIVEKGLPLEYLGKICKITLFGVALEKSYFENFGIGNYNEAKKIYEYCHCKSRYQMSLMFVNEAPVLIHGMKFYCFTPVGVGVSNGDFYWFTLNQVMICSDF